MDSRSLKRVFILIAAFLILAVFVLAGYFFLKPDPSCFDKKQNQGEEGVDCGGPCSPCEEEVRLSDLQVLSAEWVLDIENKFDALIRVKNPNQDYGVSDFSLSLSFLDESGQVFAQEEFSENYILPGEEKEILVQGVVLEKSPAKVQAEIEKGKVAWQLFSTDEEPVLIINNPRYGIKSGGEFGFAEASGTLINKSRNDFSEILIKVVLRDSNGKLLAVNSQAVNTVRADERRDFLLIFPHSFSGGENAIPYFDAETDVFDDENLISL